MESQHQKWVNLSYLAVAILVSFVVFTIGIKLAGTYDLEAKIRDIEMIVRIGSIVLGGVTFLILYRNEQATQFMHEVVEELARVTWPTQKETASATVVVIVMVLITGLLLGLFDYIWTRVIAWIL